MKGRAVRGFLLAAFLVLLVGCIGDTAPTVITGATDRASTRLPNFGDPEELEETLVALGECVEKRFPIVMRFRADAFIGLTTEVGSQREEDGERIDSEVADCMGHFDLERRLSAYLSEHPISGADQRKLVEDFISCARAVSPEVSDLVSEAALNSHNSVMTFLSELRPQNEVLPADELIAVSDCESEMTGRNACSARGIPGSPRRYKNTCEAKRAKSGIRTRSTDRWRIRTCRLWAVHPFD
jgi:hypothetical protein